MLEHGGNLLQFSRQYQIPVAEWLDLSTGVSPFAYPCTSVPSAVWNRLPELNDGLEEAAAGYYGCEPLLAVAGSQAAIMALPEVIATQRGELGVVLLPRVGYKEHQHAWQHFIGPNGAKWQIEFYDTAPSESELARADVVVVINPNNPTGVRQPLELLQQWQAQLQQRQGLLIVDEAFIDCTPQHSLLSRQLGDNVVVLRSVGKFFGLAGARVGFLFGNHLLLDAIALKLGPWTVPGPSRWVTREALLDRQWQRRMRQQLAGHSSRLRTLLTCYFSTSVSGSELFQTVCLHDAPMVHQQLCRHAILTRLCDEKNALRFGLPRDESEWQRLDVALKAITQSV
ncbi:threonine-phosphate decarboxylase CobD [Photobacterium alginatilyticum]|uniref:threonine-phosphate decarboxylase n=1 Tax=Photobacterium alginatilyticum TaxID=1775171 RepID=A0ABW9YH05_9GAMM|nr:threonine-phosphate decarboxylase CobD [Photobacterium alginatilyticum]NBI52985.1 threonine-phosphate decarboxylase [Photobacterium alginatilyticum]